VYRLEFNIPPLQDMQNDDNSERSKMGNEKS
jgi:hypothetical protein